MTRPPRRWRRQTAERLGQIRRMLLAGAVVGVLVAIVAQVALHDRVGAETLGLMRFAMLVPVAMYVLWWMLGPGMTLGQQRLLDDATLPQGSSAAERAEQIAATFDEAIELTDREFGQVSVDLVATDDLRAEYGATLRRPEADQVAATGFPGSLGHGRKRRGA